ncbi:MAG: O-antigen ligase family protein [Pseudomonas sp.]
MPARRSSDRSSTRTRYLTTASSRGLLLAMGLLLTLCWMLGGVTVDDTSADELLQLAALPVIAWATWRLSAERISRTMTMALALMALLIALPLWQLLPLPHALGMAGAARPDLAADLAVAGVPIAKTHASLSVLATERSLWSLLPALALFLGALMLRGQAVRRILQLVLGLVLASAAFAFYQLSLPDGSSLLLYTSWGRNFGGVFVNPNHQGTALAMGAVIALAMFMDGRRRARQHGGYRHWLYAAVCASCFAMIPMVNGSAAVLLLLVGLVAVSVTLGVRDWKSSRRKPKGMVPVAAAILMGMVVLSSAVAWQRVDQDRQIFATTTVKIGKQFAPLGTGMGTFVPIYAQYQDLKQARSETINHAHDEYAQWWLEGGVPALLVLAAALGLFGWTGWQVLARMPSRRLRTVAAASWTCLLLLLLHSVVDFPLRTTTLMATAGLLAGLLFNTVNASRREMDDDQDREAAPQRA